MMKTTIKLLSILLLVTLSTSAWAVRQPPGDTEPVADRDQHLGCNAVVPFTIGETVNGDNSGIPNGANLYSCQAWDMWGGEDLYEVTVTEAGTYVITLFSEDCDLGVMLLDDCYRFATCLGSSDEIEAGIESFTVQLNLGTYYIVIDGFWFDEGCPYELFMGSGEDPGTFELGTDRCDDTPLVCLEPSDEPRRVLTTNDYHLFTADYQIDFSCLIHGHWDSPDAVYAMALSDGDELTVNLWTDYMTAYVTDDCDQRTCLAGTATYLVDLPQSFTYTHSGDYRLVFLVVAGMPGSILDTCIFEYTHNGDCALAVHNEDATWGAVKTMYR